jgi:hypothetical protein
VLAEPPPLCARSCRRCVKNACGRPSNASGACSTSRSRRLTPENAPWYTGRDVLRREVVGHRASIASSKAFDRWRDLFAAAEEQRDAARRTMDDYAAPYAEKRAAQVRHAQAIDQLNLLQTRARAACRATSTPTATSRPRASCRATTSRACRSWRTSRDQRWARAADLPPAPALPRPVRVRAAQPRLPRGPRLPRRAGAAVARPARRRHARRAVADEVRPHLRRAAALGTSTTRPRCATRAAPARDRRDREQRLPHRERLHAARRAHHRERRGAPAAGLRAADHLRVGAAGPRARRAPTRRSSTPTARSRASPTGPAPRSRGSTRASAAARTRRQLGFKIDPVSGYWARTRTRTTSPPIRRRRRGNGSSPACRTARTRCSSRRRRVADRRPPIATLQHALLRGIEAVFQLEEGEILAEPMPTRDARNGFLLYEATEGGAGVLTRSSPSPRASPRSRARRCRSCTSTCGRRLAAERPDGLVDQPNTACVAACYRCLMSYYNQPDHELIDRRDEGVRAMLLRLAAARSRCPVAVSAPPPAFAPASSDSAFRRPG